MRLLLIQIILLVTFPQWVFSYYFYGGIPKKNGFCCDVKVLENIGYVVGYSETNRNPVWVGYELLNPRFKIKKRPLQFFVDPRTISRVVHEDYTDSGYDRGHMATNRDIGSVYGAEAQMETFLMSNISPQKPLLNRKEWKKLEDKIWNEDLPFFGRLFIITGPVFEKNREFLPNTKIDIPGAFFKIIVYRSNNQPKVLGYIIPQQVTGDEPLEKFLVSIDEIEKKTGFDFLWELEDEVEKNIESSLPGSTFSLKSYEKTKLIYPSCTMSMFKNRIKNLSPSSFLSGVSSNTIVDKKY